MSLGSIKFQLINLFLCLEKTNCTCRCFNRIPILFAILSIFVIHAVVAVMV